MFFKFMLFCFFLISVPNSQSREKVLTGYDPKVDIIAENYEAGPYLIYDCVEKHWTCVLESYFEECQNKRAQDITDNMIYLRCAPIGKLPNKKSCFQKQLFFISQNLGQKFCVSNEWKEKEIDL